MVDNGTPPPLPARPLCAAGTCSGALRCGTQTGIKLLRKAKTSRMRTMEGTIAEVIGEVTVQGDDAVRNRSTEQIMRLTKTMEGMSTTQLKLLFDALVRALAAQRPHAFALTTASGVLSAGYGQERDPGPRGGAEAGRDGAAGGGRDGRGDGLVLRGDGCRPLWHHRVVRSILLLRGLKARC